MPATSTATSVATSPSYREDEWGEANESPLDLRADLDSVANENIRPQDVLSVFDKVAWYAQESKVSAKAASATEDGTSFRPYYLLEMLDVGIPVTLLQVMTIHVREPSVVGSAISAIFAMLGPDESAKAFKKAKVFSRLDFAMKHAVFRREKTLLIRLIRLRTVLYRYILPKGFKFLHKVLGGEAFPLSMISGWISMVTEYDFIILEKQRDSTRREKEKQALPSRLRSERSNGDSADKPFSTRSVRAFSGSQLERGGRRLSGLALAAQSAPSTPVDGKTSTPSTPRVYEKKKRKSSMSAPSPGLDYNSTNSSSQNNINYNTASSHSNPTRPRISVGPLNIEPSESSPSRTHQQSEYNTNSHYFVKSQSSDPSVSTTVTRSVSNTSQNASGARIPSSPGKTSTPVVKVAHNVPYSAPLSIPTSPHRPVSSNVSGNATSSSITPSLHNPAHADKAVKGILRVRASSTTGMSMSSSPVLGGLSSDAVVPPTPRSLLLPSPQLSGLIIPGMEVVPVPLTPTTWSGHDTRNRSRSTGSGVPHPLSQSIAIQQGIEGGIVVPSPRVGILRTTSGTGEIPAPVFIFRSDQVSYGHIVPSPRSKLDTVASVGERSSRGSLSHTHTVSVSGADSNLSAIESLDGGEKSSPLRVVTDAENNEFSGVDSVDHTIQAGSFYVVKPIDIMNMNTAKNANGKATSGSQFAVPVSAFTVTDSPSISNFSNGARSLQSSVSIDSTSQTGSNSRLVMNGKGKVITMLKTSDDPFSTSGNFGLIRGVDVKILSSHRSSSSDSMNNSTHDVGMKDLLPGVVSSQSDDPLNATVMKSSPSANQLPPSVVPSSSVANSNVAASSYSQLSKTLKKLK